MRFNDEINADIDAIQSVKPKRNFLTGPRLILISLLAILIPSATLLMFPIFSVTGLEFSDAFFMATSAISVTGLGVVDTGEHFTLAGKILLMFLMQVGGLGQMTLSAVLLYTIGIKMSLKQQAITREALGQEKHVNIKKLVKRIVFFAFFTEMFGVLILMIRWVPEMGLGTGTFYALFHSVSAFNNAGFSLFSTSLVHYVDDPLVIVPMALLFILGGIGFTVIADVYANFRRGFLTYQLHTKVMLICTPILLLIGTILLYLLEKDNMQGMGNLSTAGQWLAAFFQSATARTAGFNSIDISHFTHPALLVMILLMLIGAGSSSTGGGIKVSTFVVAMTATWAFLRQQKHVTLFRRTIHWDVVTRSLAVIVVSGLLLTIAMFLLMITEKATFSEVLFETISAFSTVGLSTGLTAELSEAGKYILIFVMIIGRIGPLTLAYMLASPKETRVKYPDGTIFTG